MRKLDVRLTLPDGQTLLCGEIFATLPDQRGVIEGSFRYSSEFLSHPRAFALDPVHLPLGPEEVFTPRPQGVHGVFEDALPDDWGRKLLVRQAKLPRAEQNVPKLLDVLGAKGLGALSFSPEKPATVEDSSTAVDELESVVETAMRYDAGMPVDDARLHVLFTCGSSPGGARPKALVKDESGDLWIAKFPKMNDSYSVEALETASLHLARDAGLLVPDFALRAVGQRKVLLVKRFDISRHGGRNHMVSLQTLLGADGFYHLSYADIFSVLNQHSSRPQEDVERLFRQMVFNIGIGNTDDHLKNFCMLHDGAGFSLSPAYDLLPDIHGNREHQLSFPQGAGTLPPGRDVLKRIGAVYKVPAPEQVIDDVVHSLAEWQGRFLQYGVPDSEIQRLKPGISQRLERLNHQR